MAQTSEQIEWLSLVNISGPFLATAVLEEVHPQGLAPLATPERQRLRSAHEEWREAVDTKDSELEAIHEEWVKMVLTEALEYKDTDLVPGDELGDKVVYRAIEHGGVVEPRYGVRGPDEKIRLLIAVHPPDTNLEKPLPGDSWPVSPAERMTLLCRSNEIRTGLVTNGEEWMLVNAPIGSTSGHATWYARIWWQEPVTFKAFCSLFSVRRCFGEPKNSLSNLLERSTEFHEEVTDTLGEQVRRAVEVLVQAVGRADQDRNGELLKDIQPQELYEAGLTVMMRLVFTLCAEERDLLLLGDPIYDQHHAVSNLRAQLREEADQHGPEVLEKRYDAWSRLLTVFRMIYGGVEHESLRLPALGGSLFDPDRFPFLEGRAHGTSWQDTTAPPLPIDNRTVLLLLRALQVLEHRGGAQLLSYRGLDVEQIGHVYEGLLEYTVGKIDGLTIGLLGSKKVPNPMVTLDELEEWQGATLAQKLAERTDRSLSVIKNALKREPDETDLPALIQACEGDEETARKLLPYVSLIRKDSWGSLMIYHDGDFAVVPGPGRRATGAHYTPRAFAEDIVEKTLEPVVYIGPAEGHPKEEWKLKPPAELLNLRLCDPAMGSGAFLVQGCRYLAERLVQGWATAEEAGKVIGVEGEVLDSGDEAELMPRELDDRLLIARRLVAERCLYGVDMNPMAVELAKLSIWLVTLQKGRPFGFLDHNLRSGDSLLGIHQLDQLTKLIMHPKDNDEPRIFGRGIEGAVAEALELRKRLRLTPIRDIRDVEAMARLDEEAKAKLEPVELIADAMIGEALQSDGKANTLASALDQLATKAGDILDGEEDTAREVKLQALKSLSIEQPAGKPARKPFHWALEFPEVFENGGFDAFVGNPPYGGKNTISDASGASYLKYISKTLHIGAHGNADLVAHFYRRAFILLKDESCFGLIATKTIAQGDTRHTGLSWICNNGGTIYKADKRVKWPGKAAVVVSIVYVCKGHFHGKLTLNGKESPIITAFLFHGGGHDNPTTLEANADKSFQGSILLGMGFTFDDTDKKDAASPIAEMVRLIKNDPRNAERIFPFIGWSEVANSPIQRHHRYVINFFDRSLEEAEEWPDLIDIVRKKVKPERDVQKRKALRERWWQYAEKRPGLVRAIAELDRVIVTGSQAMAQFALTFLPKGIVYSSNLSVLAIETNSGFATVQSRVHEVWSRFFMSTMKDDLAYTTTTCFETFPFPEECQTDPALEAAGKTYYEFRADLMVRTDEGLTKTYNRFHDPNEKDADILKLRELHVAMDRAVLDAYGWHDISTDCEFIADYEVDEGKKIPWRYRWPEEVHDEVLARLMDLNQKRHEEESNQSQSTKKKPATKRAKKDDNQSELF